MQRGNAPLPKPAGRGASSPVSVIDASSPRPTGREVPPTGTAAAQARAAAAHEQAARLAGQLEALQRQREKAGEVAKPTTTRTPKEKAGE